MPTADGRLVDIARPKRLFGFPVGSLGRRGMMPRKILRLANSAEEAAGALQIMIVRIRTTAASVNAILAWRSNNATARRQTMHPAARLAECRLLEYQLS